MMASFLTKVVRSVWPFSRTTSLNTKEALLSGTNQTDKRDAGGKSKVENDDRPVRKPLPKHTLSTELRFKFYAVALNADTRDLPNLNDTELATVRKIDEQLRSGEFRSKAVPRLPAVVPQLLQSLRDPNASAYEYVEIIQRDPVLASSVLRMVNSAYYNPSRKAIDSFHRAVVTLGLDGMRSLLSGAVMQPIIQCKSTQYSEFGKQLWDHSSCCALCCQILAKSQDIEPFKAYLAGLIHDIGTITLFTQITKQYRRDDNSETPLHCITHIIEESGHALSYTIAKDWGFPEDILQAVKDQTSIAVSGKISRLGKLLFIANYLCEVYALLSSGDLTEAQASEILADIDAPSDLFERLDQLNMTADE